MKVKKQMLYPKIKAYCRSLESEFGLIPSERKEKLRRLSGYIFKKTEAGAIPGLVVICTHNSRRSHIGQLWLAVGAEYYNLPEVHTFSGGTEATAFNLRAVRAFERIGFEISIEDNNSGNPIYNVGWKSEGQPYRAFSKKYEAAPNPKGNFAAIMVCSEADEGCPFVFGSDFRLSLPYDDPKAFDDTDSETVKYDERVRQIGREMLFVLSGVGEVS